MCYGEDMGTDCHGSVQGLIRVNNKKADITSVNLFGIV